MQWEDQDEESVEKRSSDAAGETGSALQTGLTLVTLSAASHNPFLLFESQGSLLSPCSQLLPHQSSYHFFFYSVSKCWGHVRSSTRLSSFFPYSLWWDSSSGVSMSTLCWCHPHLFSELTHSTSHLASPLRDLENSLNYVQNRILDPNLSSHGFLHLISRTVICPALCPPKHYHSFLSHSSHQLADIQFPIFISHP